MQKVAAIFVLLLAVNVPPNVCKISSIQSDNRVLPMLRRLLVLANSQQTRLGVNKESPAAIDFLIAFDSTTVAQRLSEFKVQKKMMSKIVSEFSISPSSVRVSLVSFSNRPRRYFNFNEHLNKECTIRAINQVRLSHGLAVQMNPQEFFKSSRGSREAATKILLMYIDGHHIVGTRLVQLVKRLRRFYNVKVFVMTIGSWVSGEAVKKMASKPHDAHIIAADNWIDLERTIDTIKHKGMNQRCSSKKRFYHDECRRLCECIDGQLSRCRRIRKEFTSMSFEERIRFIETIKTANLHPLYRKQYEHLTDVHSEQFLNGIHTKNFFLPWHRWFLYEFENFLRQIDCRVTIPYWDWARAANTVWRESRAADIWYPGPHGLGGNGKGERGCVTNGPFGRGHWYLSEKSGYGCLERNFSYANTPHGSEAVENTVDSSFDVFEYNIRKIFHNEIHCLVGGTMDLSTSSQAPEFWLHHAFLDKIWVQYQMRGEQRKNEFYPDVVDHLPGCRQKWQPKVFINEKELPGCVHVMYEDVEKRVESRQMIRTFGLYSHPHNGILRCRMMNCCSLIDFEFQFNQQTL